ncbi:MAG: hypothetical protein R3C17_03320 [Planctomycetaceae bacterium]
MLFHCRSPEPELQKIVGKSERESDARATHVDAQVPDLPVSEALKVKFCGLISIQQAACFEPGTGASRSQGFLQPLA